MSKESLFDLIRKEEVIIWAGAGMSMYAGYPSGNRLKEILINSLSDGEKKEIDKSLSLIDLTDQIFQLKNGSRNHIIKVLKKTFNAKPVSTSTHEDLAKIPHFKTIITTNYDKLFESSYESLNHNVIFSKNHIPYIENKKVNIFKVHGDLNDPDSIVLTKSDYTNFFTERNDDNTYWSIVRERLATNSVLFIGYSLEDINTNVIFDRIINSLGVNRKECFFVSPNLSQPKINSLIKKNIHYIDSTAEELITELILHLKEYIHDDLENNKISADTHKKFLSNFGLLSKLEVHGEDYRVTGIRSKNKEIYLDGVINMIFKDGSQNIKSDIQKFINREKVGMLEITKKDHLIDAEFWLGGLKMPKNNEIDKIYLKSMPQFNEKVDFRYDDGFEINDVNVKIYGSEFLFEIHIETVSAIIVVKTSFSGQGAVKADFNYEHKEICENVNSEITLFKFLNRICNGEKFVVYTKKNNIPFSSFSKSPEFQKVVSLNLQHFLNLKTIENFFNVRFSNFKIEELNDSTRKTVNFLCEMINGNQVISLSDTILLTLDKNYDDKTIKQLKTYHNSSSDITIPIEENKIIKLYGENLKIGNESITVMNASIDNLEEIISRTNNVVRIRSKDNRVYVHYKKQF
ncbi:SIR2 family protein [Kordia algicida OT-1]|uniref:Uncharacterized protein n=1 Tax=Kordia algicida OT-1 TaxID=391587 RepID=A9E6S3_9FLAO|nr:SIR2 family protein [Kordia algicida]EDP95078.1 hypothetical protein KAOT1_02044 [Kordia algicida OT-1]